MDLHGNNDPYKLVVDMNITTREHSSRHGCWRLCLRRSYPQITPIQTRDGEALLKPAIRNSMKVLHIIPSVSATAGGPSQAMMPMCRALARQGLDVVLATTNDGLE